MPEENLKDGKNQTNGEVDTGSEPLVLTDRDIAVFQLAHEQRFVCYNQISAGFWKERSEHAKACWHRVERLLNAGYLQKEYSPRKKLQVYFATEKAVAELKTRSLDAGIPAFKMRPYYDRNIGHDLNVTNIRLLFREFGLHQWTSERILWEREHLFHKPDGVLTLRGRKIAIEFENGLTKSHARYQATLDYYNDHEGYRLLFMIIKGDTRDWLVDLKYDARKIWFAGFNELMNEKEKTLFENKRARFELSRLL